MGEMGRPSIDITGWVMSEHGIPDSRLIVIGKTNIVKNRHIMWECVCSCGSDKTVMASGWEIRKGKVKSCGCLHIQHTTEMGKNNKKYNDYRIDGDVVIGKCSNSDDEFYVDLEDFDKIKDISWSLHINNHGFKKLNGTMLNTYETVSMHAYLGYKNYDHIDRNELNNCKSNLRPATVEENARNHSLRKDNKSGFSGVWWDTESNKWLAYIKADGKMKKLGRFVNKTDAIIARLYAEIQYYGTEFAPQRHLFEEYGIQATEEENK